MNFEDFKKLFLRFWRSENKKTSLVRDVVVAIIAVLIILTLLWAYTGQWFGAPMVVIESGSMMHANEPFGRLGTIDAGDMVLLVKVNKRSDVVTYGSAREQGKEGLQTYGSYGDVVIYRKYGNSAGEQIIHRAMCWVEVGDNGNEKTYTITEYGIYNRTSLLIPELGIESPSGGPYTPNWDHSGFITKGDNPVTNRECDQMGGISTELIKLEWISGKARMELPWVGTISLIYNDLKDGNFWNGREVITNNVQSDCVTCLIILIAVLVSIPISLDLYDYYKTKKKQKL
ncbi:MAG: S26 family signal peptidase [Euryarchaeota archaeon]|nr:S26 family signal peptidase [Euryarchaeota archaeon]